MDHYEYIKQEIQEKNFYTSKSLENLIVKKYGVSISVTSISKILQRLRKEGYVSYDKQNRLWKVTKDKQSKETIKDPNKNSKPSLPNQSFDASEIIVSTLYQVTKQMVNDALIDVMKNNYDELIIKTVQETVCEELHTELKPAILDYINQKIKNEINNSNLKEEIINIITPLIEIQKQCQYKINKIYKTFETINR